MCPGRYCLATGSRPDTNGHCFSRPWLCSRLEPSPVFSITNQLRGYARGSNWRKTRTQPCFSHTHRNRADTRLSVISSINTCTERALQPSTSYVASPPEHGHQVLRSSSVISRCCGIYSCSWVHRSSLQIHTTEENSASKQRHASTRRV